MPITDFIDLLEDDDGIQLFEPAMSLEKQTTTSNRNRNTNTNKRKQEDEEVQIGGETEGSATREVDDDNTPAMKIIAEVRPQDAFFLSKTRGATLSFVWKDKQYNSETLTDLPYDSIGSSQEFQNQLTQIWKQKLEEKKKKGWSHIAFEVIY